MISRIAKILPLVISLFLVFSTNVRSENSKHRPRIGLVLAGGGALGFAHVGVLKVLEENRIPVDYVAGTSMGAIVGAAYATGQTVSGMEEVLTSTDWDDLFSETPARENLPYRIKPGRDGEIFGDTKVSFKDGGIVMPMGVVQGQKVLPLLQRLYGNEIASPADFDKFPIPLRVVAGDIETGEGVVISKGDVAKAVRASMSVPGFFAPVEIDGRMLVDGGIANNLPMDVVRQMGADMLIVVELNADLKKQKDLTSPLSISGQIISLLLAQNAAAQKKTLQPQDILIEPNLTGYTSTDFAKGKELMKLGEEAARKALSRLKKLSVGDSVYQAYKQKCVPASEEVQLKFVRINSNSPTVKQSLEENASQFKNKEFNRDEVEKYVGDLFQEGTFSSVSYNVITENGQNGLEITANKKEWFKDYVRIGAKIEDDFEGNSTYSLGASYRANDLNSYGAWSETDLLIGNSPNFSTEFYQPLGLHSSYFINPKIEVGRQTLYPRVDNDIVAQYLRSQLVGEVSLGRQLTDIGEISLGYRRGAGDIDRHIGDPNLPEAGYDIGEFRARATLDSQDDPDFPTRGVFARLTATDAIEDVGSDDDYQILGARVSAPYTFGRSTILFRGDTVESYDGLSADRSFAMGGFFNFSGYTQNSLLASDYNIVRAAYYRRISESESPLFNLGLYVGGTAEWGNFRNDSATFEDPGSLWAGSGFLGINTPILPLYIGAGFSEGGERSIYFALGRVGNRQN